MTVMTASALSVSGADRSIGWAFRKGRSIDAAATDSAAVSGGVEHRRRTAERARRVMRAAAQREQNRSERQDRR